MGVDLRQVVAGILTLTMFVMLGQMIKRDHFDSAQVKTIHTLSFTHFFFLLFFISDFRFRCLGRTNYMRYFCVCVSLESVRYFSVIYFFLIEIVWLV